MLHSTWKPVFKSFSGRFNIRCTSTHLRISMDIDGTVPLNALPANDTSCRRSARLLSASMRTQLSRPLDEANVTPVCLKRKRRQAIYSTSAKLAVIAPETSKAESPEPLYSSQDMLEPSSDGEDNDNHATTLQRELGQRRPQPESVYIIPDIEKKSTTFKGRLGYACLNTILRGKKPAAESVFCSRTCRLDSVKKNGIEFAKALGRRNAEDLLTIIQWNEDNNIRLFRVSSEMFPFASHGTYGYSLDYCADVLAKAGDLANKYGHRLTTHPGQFTQLGSPKTAVVEAAVRDLAYHCQMLDLMGMGSDSVVIIHGGGVYNDKPTTLERLKESIKALSSNIRQRIVLENDEMCYNAEDLLAICEELDVPFIFDYHHDNIYPSSLSRAKIIERANAIFARRGIKPKQHLSEPRSGAVTLMERRAHSDRCENLPSELPDDMDLMIEAKDKEQAVLYLHRMYELQPVSHESLRPAAENQSKRTNGRKTTKRARTQLAKDISSGDDKA